MNEQNSQEIAYRRQAFKLFEKEKSVAQILAIIPRSRSWLFKWKQRFNQEGWQALDSLPKAPRHSPQRCSPEAVKLVLHLRKRMEKSQVGLKCARAIHQEILRHRLLRPVPSLASIKRWLKDAGLTRPDLATEAGAYYPVIREPEQFFILACDWLARYPQGAPKVFVFHSIDLQTRALAQTILLDKTAESADKHLRQAFAEVGLPDFLQIDNDPAFTGFGRTKPVFGRIIRLVLYLGIEPIFIPHYEPRRNHDIERVNGLWSRNFWERNHFRSHRDLLRRRKKFLTWYQTYAPPALGGLTVVEATRRCPRQKLRPRQMANIPEVLPLTAGRIHFLRRRDGRGRDQYSQRAVEGLQEPDRAVRLGDARFEPKRTLDLSSPQLASTASTDQTARVRNRRTNRAAVASIQASQAQGRDFENNLKVVLRAPVVKDCTEQ